MPGYLLRALGGRDARGEVGPYPARRVLRDPLERLLFALAAPEGVYPSTVGMPISPPLLRAACPRQNTEKCRDLKNLRAGPRYVRTAAEE